MQSNFSLELTPKPLNLLVNNQDYDKEKLCKFCYQNEIESVRQLVSPCSCSGSLKYVHKQCLQRWLQIQDGIRSKTQTDINFYLSNCSIKCKLCAQQIIFKKELSILSRLLLTIHWIRICRFGNKLKFCTCISILGFLAINYYLIRYLVGKIWNIGTKIKNNSFICLLILLIVLVLIQYAIIQVRWSKSTLSFYIAHFDKK